MLANATEIYVAFSELSFLFLLRSALGVARNFHKEDDDDGIQKSISVSKTFRTIRRKAEFVAKIYEIAEDLERRVAKRKIGGRTLTLELKNTHFQVT